METHATTNAATKAENAQANTNPETEGSRARERLKFGGFVATVVLWLIGIGAGVWALSVWGAGAGIWGELARVAAWYVAAPAASIGTVGVLLFAHAGYGLDFRYGTALALVPVLVAPLYAAMQSLTGPLDPTGLPIWLRRAAVAAPILGHVHGVFAVCRESLRARPSSAAREHAQGTQRSLV